MTKNTLTRSCAYILYITTALMFLGYFSYRNTALLNIGAYSSLAFALIIIYQCPQLLKIIKFSYSRNKLLVICLLIYIVYLLLSSIFYSYKGLISLSLSEVFDNLRYAVILFLIYIALQNKHVNKYFFFILLISIVFITIIMPLNNHFFPNNALPLALKFRYGYNLPLTLLYPFILCLLFYNSKKMTIASVTILSLVIFTIIIASGGRGSFIAILIELFIFIGIYCYLRKMAIKTILVSYLTLFIALALALAIGYFNSNCVQGKILQNFSEKNFTSGRVELIQTRFPIFTEHGSILFGIGFGNKIYQEFLQDHHAPKVIGMYEVKDNKEVFSYHHDEPQFLAVFYESGLMGLLLFTLFALSFLYSCMRYASINNTEGVMAIAIGLSIIGNTFILGLVEHTNINNLFFFAVLFIMLTTNKQVNNRSLGRGKPA